MAKRLVATGWKTPHSLAFCLWALSFLDIVYRYMELSTALLHGANEKNIKIWAQVADAFKDMI